MLGGIGSNNIVGLCGFCGEQSKAEKGVRTSTKRSGWVDVSAETYLRDGGDKCGRAEGAKGSTTEREKFKPVFLWIFEYC